MFFRASISSSKILNVTIIFNTVKIFRANSVFRASASSLKILKDKIYCNTEKNFKANSVFQSKRK